MVAKEGADDDVLVLLVAPLEHGVETAGAGCAVGGRRQRREGQGGGALEVAGHQEAAGRQGRQRVLVGAAGAQIGGEGGGEAFGLWVVGRRGGVGGGQCSEERGGFGGSAGELRAGEGLLRPFGKAERQQ